MNASKSDYEYVSEKLVEVFFRDDLSNAEVAVAITPLMDRLRKMVGTI